MVVNRNGLLLGLILIVAAVVRIYALSDFSNGRVNIVGSCGQLMNEVKPLVASRNILHFDEFYYPPVAPIIIASTWLLSPAMLQRSFDLDGYCLGITMLFSMGTIVLVYFVGKELWAPPAGLVAAAFYAVTMIAMDTANTVQSYPTFFLMLAILLCFRSIRNPTSIRLSLMGICL